ncbi:MAG: ATP-binding protein [Ferruginibacter sp.]
MFLAIDISLVVIGIIVMLLLFASLMYSFTITQNKKLKYQREMQQLRESQQNQLIEAAIRSEESVRHSISEALHDEVGAILSSSKLHLQGIKNESLDAYDKELHEKGKFLLDEGIQKVRSISHNLHSNILKELGLNEAINHFMNKICQGTILKATTSLDENYAGKNSESDMSLYRMVQELVNNIMKHAHAKEINISSSFINEQLVLTIKHDGKGLSQEQFEAFRYNKEGLGLKNIQNRVILLKGSIEFFTAENNSSISIYVPAKTAAI